MAEHNPSSSKTTHAIENQRSEDRTTDELPVNASKNTTAPWHHLFTFEVEPLAAQHARQTTVQKVNWLHTLPQHVPLMKKRKVSDRTESRVTLWNPTEKRKLSGNAAPFESNVESYLLMHPVSLLE